LRMSTARVVAATNRDLRIETKAARFRVDLYHRLSVFTIQVPPLRDLGDDKSTLLEHFTVRYAAQAGIAPCTLDDDAKGLWKAYAFPGNVRELRNIVIRLTTKYAGREVSRPALAEELDFQSNDGTGSSSGNPFLPSVEAALAVLSTRRSIDLDASLQAWEGCFVEAALQLTRGNLAHAARMLGMHRTTLYSRMQSRDSAADDTRVRPPTSA